jgi:hypothetical protein
MCWFLRPIWRHVSGLIRFCNASDKGTTSNFVQISEKVWRRPGNDYTSVRGRKHGPYTWSPNSPRPKMVRQVKSKIKSMIIIFFNIKGIVNKESILEGQTVNSAYYCEVLQRMRENKWRFCPQLWWQKNWPLDHDNAPSRTSFFTGEFLTRNNMTVVPHPP